MQCVVCHKEGSDKQLSSGFWHHKDCYDKMPAKFIFPANAWKKPTAQDNLDKLLKEKIKNGKLVI